MIQVLSRLSSPDLVQVLVLGGGFLVAIVLGLGISITAALQRHWEQERAANLVLQLLERGVSPEEISSILRAMGLDQPPNRRGGRLRRLLRHFGSSAEASPPSAS